AREVYSVSRLNREVKWLLSDSFPRLWIEGEISNLSRPASGHWYFTLKDEAAQVRCAMFRRHNRNLGFVPENGMQVLVRAQVSLYEARGEFQLVVEVMEEAGDGALRRAFEALKRRLAAEGLFASELKRPLPSWPRHLGIVTSPTGAAIRDVLTVLKRRFPALEITVYPCQVQGDSAKHEIVRALELANRHGLCDVLLLVRGGGSLEDLWPFNEEIVARAIRSSRIPVVTGIGHEIDFTIADFAADLRAPTPSAAAETVSPDAEAILRQVQTFKVRLKSGVGRQLKLAQHQLQNLLTRLERNHPARQLGDKMLRLDELDGRLNRAVGNLLLQRHQRLTTHRARLLRHHPGIQLQQHRQQLTRLIHNLDHTMQRRLESARLHLAQLSRALDAVSPLGTLQRGYALAIDRAGHVLTDARKVHPGDEIDVRLARGQLTCEVKEVKHG
ncbi:MAG TPA: exodeoxyribonuclease VII large subunit, partial [Methylothermaceae bacterium]|nr:exodeoxyribonuclease VII large subunit [Methylothermaceae bacterium]